MQHNQTDEVEDPQLAAAKAALFSKKSQPSSSTQAVAAAPKKNEKAVEEDLSFSVERLLSELHLSSGGAGPQGDNDNENITEDHFIELESHGEFLKHNDDEVMRQVLEQMENKKKEKNWNFRSYCVQNSDSLKSSENACVEDYLSSSVDLVRLHSQIHSCDTILETMEAMLSKFQGDLGAISAEIHDLQNRSTSMNIKLKNRKSAETKLGEFIGHIFIPDDLVDLMLDGELSDHYVYSLSELHVKLQYIESHPDSIASCDMQPVADKIKKKCIGRIRQFLLERFHSLKTPKTNIQIKQKSLLKFAYFYQFLLFHTDSAIPRDVPDVALEIRNAYHETMSVIYHSKFKKYLTEMKGLLKSSDVQQGDVLTRDVGAKVSTSLFSTFVSSKATTSLDTMFVLGDRATVLTQQQELIIPHIVGKTGKKLEFEKIFKSAVNLLMDTATSEYDFIVEFFGERMARESDRAGMHEEAIELEKEKERKEKEGHGKEKKVSSRDVPIVEKGRENFLATSRDKHLFNFVFGSTLNLFFDFLGSDRDGYLGLCYDCLSVLLLIRIISCFNLEMQSRRVHCLDHMFDRMNMTLWPKFKKLFDQQVDALKAIKSIGPDINVKEKVMNFKAHVVSLRYAELASSVLLLNQPYQDEILHTSLKRLRIELIKLLERSVKFLSVKQQSIFLIQNYQSIFAILSKRGQEESEDAQEFKRLSADQISLYGEDELRGKFHDFIAFTLQMEQDEKRAQHAASSSSSTTATSSSSSDQTFPLNLSMAEELNKAFIREWKNKIVQIKENVQLHFKQDGESVGGSTSSAWILGQILIQLVLYYSRFEEIINKYKKKNNLQFVRPTMMMAAIKELTGQI